VPLATIELSSLGGRLVGRGQDRPAAEELQGRRGGPQAGPLPVGVRPRAARRHTRFAPARPTRFDCNVEVGGKVAFHNFFLDRSDLRRTDFHDDAVASRLQGFADGRGGAAMLIRYAADHGAAAGLRRQPDGATGRGVSVPRDDRGVPGAQPLSRSGSSGPRLPMSHQAANVCNNSLAAPGAGVRHDRRARSSQPRRFSQYMLERVQDGLNAARARGKLADQLATWSVMRIEAKRSTKLYDDLRAAGVALPGDRGSDLRGRPSIEAWALSAPRLLRQPVRRRIRTGTTVVLQGPRGLAEAVAPAARQCAPPVPVRPPAPSPTSRPTFGSISDRVSLEPRDAEDRQVPPLGSGQRARPSGRIARP
jgi:hypothetical protein